jgi:hypothetical protein
MQVVNVRGRSCNSLQIPQLAAEPVRVRIAEFSVQHIFQ